MTLSRHKSKLEIAPLIIAICVFCLLRPFFLWTMPNYLKFGLFPLLYLFAIVPNMDLKKGNALLLGLFIVLLTYLVLSEGYGLSFSMAILSLAVVPFINERVYKKSFFYFEVILAILLGGGLLFYLAHLFGLPLSGQYLAPLNEEKSFGYTLYIPFLVVPNGFSDYFRFCGPFDEPGVVGTVTAFILFIEKYKLKKWYLAIIFIAGFLSFSFFFIVITLLFLAFHMTKSPSRAIVAVLLALAFYGTTKNIAVLDELIYSRFEINSDTGLLAGDNRSSEAQRDYFNSILGTEEFLFGNHGKTAGEFGNTRSYMDAVLNYGFIFCFLYILWFYVFARNKNLSVYSALVFITVLLCNFYQRPNFLHFSYIFLYTAFIIGWELDEISMAEKIKRKQWQSKQK